jgi:hypothetical protein
VEPKSLDPFVARFLARVPAEVAETFTEAQLKAVKSAFDRGGAPAHLSDIRISIPLITRRLYFVLLAGRERRSTERLTLERGLRSLWLVGNTVVVAALALMLMVSAATGLYVGKRAFGINVLPGIDMLPDEEIEGLLERKCPPRRGGVAPGGADHAKRSPIPVMAAPRPEQPPGA